MLVGINDISTFLTAVTLMGTRLLIFETLENNGENETFLNTGIAFTTRESTDTLAQSRSPIRASDGTRSQQDKGGVSIDVVWCAREANALLRPRHSGD
ncbi:hypothetical protein E2C01_074506 [Portunus trituberculatus]|uniref:Uncharacterized protein n=1 Tax=Portunus trituberculatus TaxID=210409 RepID=A0A5B7IDB9_PORTR|nr:hypothetical protein [Portunus trituberculatus]